MTAALPGPVLLVLRNRVLWLMLVCPGLCQAVAAGKQMPSTVQDLQYGEVLYHYYQQDYFTAITHLMAAQQQQRLEHHLDESELLLGGLQLSYGMLDQAERRFERLLDENTDKALRDRVKGLKDQLDGEAFEFLAARDRLLVVTRAGTLFCFGPGKRLVKTNPSREFVAQDRAREVSGTVHGGWWGRHCRS